MFGFCAGLRSAIAAAMVVLLSMAGASAHNLEGIASEGEDYLTFPLVKESHNDSNELEITQTMVQALALSNEGKVSLSTIETYGVFVKRYAWGAGTVINVCFYDGSVVSRLGVKNAARQWSEFGNVIFDFGTLPNLRQCSSSDKSLVRIAFKGASRSSLIGTQSKERAMFNMVTMNLGGLDVLDPKSDEFVDVVLHEFGHALGLHHEHQHPYAFCEGQFNKFKIMELKGWGDAAYHRNMEKLKASSPLALGDGLSAALNDELGDLILTGYDSESIMHYSLDKIFFNDPPGSCYVAQNHGLSRLDKLLVRTVHPNRPSREVRQSDAKIINILRSRLSDAVQTKALDSLLR